MYYYFQVVFVFKIPGKCLSGKWNVLHVQTCVFMFYTNIKSILHTFIFFYFFLFSQHSKIKRINVPPWNSLAVSLEDPLLIINHCALVKLLLK